MDVVKFVNFYEWRYISKKSYNLTSEGSFYSSSTAWTSGLVYINLFLLEENAFQAKQSFLFPSEVPGAWPTSTD